MKTKGFLTAAAISVALAFTFTGCTDDSGSDEDNNGGVSSSSGGGAGTPSSSSGGTTGTPSSSGGSTGGTPSSSSSATTPSSSSGGGGDGEFVGGCRTYVGEVEFDDGMGCRNEIFMLFMSRSWDINDAHEVCDEITSDIDDLPSYLGWNDSIGSETIGGWLEWFEITGWTPNFDEDSDTVIYSRRECLP
jgi:hypothetical protein